MVEPDPRICLLSQRNLQREFHRCANYEQEDVLCAADNVELLAPQPIHERAGARRWRNRLAYRIPQIRFDPGIRPVRINRRYELFMTYCEFVHDLRTLDVVSGFSKHCRLSVCYLTEFWARAIPQSRDLIRRLAPFDVIFTNCAATVEPLRKAIDRPCHYVLPGIDALRFVPPTNPPPRVIDVYSMGRRDPIVHAELLKLRRERGLFYLHDTYDLHGNNDWGVKDFREHRQMTADLIQRSRFFIVNPAKVDLQNETGGQQEIGYRFFEGAAGGSIMIGRPVDSERFRNAFDWPDAVIPAPADGRAIGGFLAELDSEPERLERCRRESIRNILLRHDWAYRWETMLAHLGIAPHQRLAERKATLARHAGATANESGPARANRLLTPVARIA